MVGNLTAPADPVDTAWRIHSALIDWTGKVDTKASFALTIESAAFAGIVAFATSTNGLKWTHSHWPLVSFRFGMGCLGLAVLLSAAAVIPQIRGGHATRNWRENFIHFGHLRKWNPEKLAKALKETDILPVLARQHVVMSRIAWRKHRLLQASMLIAVLGIALVFVPGLNA